MTTLGGLHRLRVNPIWQKCVRARMRRRHMASWGVVTLTITAFVAIMIYTTMTQRELTSREVAAEAVLPAVIVIQSILLMMFGTGALAAGISQERDEGLLDYQRMTPMRPTAKILGYLFGLPAREYALFAMTLPIVAIAVAVSGFSVRTLAHFYLVFFTSVWVYHMTGLVAGMVAPKARVALMLSVGLVAVLYFVLPNLSRLGITFFEFLTIRPTFFGLVQQELPAHLRAPAEASGIDSFRDVPLFGTLVHPTAYTLLVQGFLIATLFSVVHRKWRNQSHHVFSKGGALVVFTGIAFFLLGSVWAIVVREETYLQIFASFDSAVRRGSRLPETLQLLLSISLVILGGGYVVLIAAVTPSRHTTVEGWRRVRKLGRKRLGPNTDAASSLPLALAMLAITLAAGAMLLWKVGSLGEYYRGGPSAGSVAVLVIGIIGVGLFVQGFRESLGLRVFGVAVFLLWMVPFFTMMIMYSAFDAFIAGSYVGLPCPPVLLLLSIAELMQTTTPMPGVGVRFLPNEIAPSAPLITVVGAAGYAAAGIGAQVFRARIRTRLRRAGMQSAGGVALATVEESPTA